MQAMLLSISFDRLKMQNSENLIQSIFSWGGGCVVCGKCGVFSGQKYGKSLSTETENVNS